MFISEEVVYELRSMSTSGLGASDMISALKEKTPPQEFNYFFVMAAFREAFGMKMPELSLLQRAKILGGGSFDDVELDALMQKHISRP